MSKLTHKYDDQLIHNLANRHSLQTPVSSTSRSHGRDPTVPRSKPKYRNLRYDGKSRWKTFCKSLWGFLKASSGPRWNNVTRVAYFWRTLSSEDYTLSLELCIYSHFVTSSINKCFIYSTWPDPQAQRLVSITTQRWVPEWVGGLYTCFSHRCLFPAAKYSLSSHTPPVLWCVWCRHWSVHLEQWRRQWTECSMIRTCVSSVERWDTSAWIALWMPADGSQKKV